MDLAKLNNTTLHHNNTTQGAKPTLIEDQQIAANLNEHSLVDFEQLLEDTISCKKITKHELNPFAVQNNDIDISSDGINISSDGINISSDSINISSGDADIELRQDLMLENINDETALALNLEQDSIIVDPQLLGPDLSSAQEMLSRILVANNTLTDPLALTKPSSHSSLTAEQLSQLSLNSNLVSQKAGDPKLDIAMLINQNGKIDLPIQDMAIIEQKLQAGENLSTTQTAILHDLQTQDTSAKLINANLSALEKAELKIPQNFANANFIMPFINDRDKQLSNNKIGDLGALADLSANEQSNLASSLQNLATQQVNSSKAELNTNVQTLSMQLTREMAQEQLSEKVQMMLSKNLKNIDIRLDPPELGKMQIKMTLNNDLANIQFNVNTQVARDIIEASLPRLREMLALQGIQLGESFVQQQNSHQGQNSQQQFTNSPINTNDEHTDLFNELSDDEIAANLDVNIQPSHDGISLFA